MTRNKLVVTLITIFAVYTLFTGLFGDKGYIVNQRLKQIEPVLQNELGILVTENKTLTDLKISFEADYQRILEEAYRYGYLQEDEFRIIYNTFTTYDNRLVSSANLGKRLVMPTGVLSQKEIIIISLLSGIFTFIIISIFYFIKRNTVIRGKEKNN